MYQKKFSDLALRTMVVFAIYHGENCPNIDSEHFSSSRSLRTAKCTYESAYRYILITLYGSNVKMEIFSFPIQTL